MMRDTKVIEHFCRVFWSVADPLSRQVKENGKEIFDRMEGGAHLYMCGLKGPRRCIC